MPRPVGPLLPVTPNKHKETRQKRRQRHAASSCTLASGHAAFEFDQVPMVGEADDLADALHLGEQAQRLLGASSADSNDVHGIPETGARILGDMKFVSEQDRLNAVSDRRERFETVARAGIVEAGEKVVADERRRLGAGGIVLNIGKS